MKTKQAVVITMLLCLLLTATVLLAQAPNLLNYQGKLTQGGSPASGNFSMTFAIYSTPTGGTALWAETQPTVQVTNGVFNVLLGSVTPFPSVLFTGTGERHLGIKVGSDPEMTPRFRLTSAGFALRASQADNVPDGSITGNKIANSVIGINHLNFTPLTASTDYGRSGVASTLFEGTTALSSKYFSLSGGSISGNVFVTGSVSGNSSSYGIVGTGAGASSSGAYGRNTNTSGTGVIGIGNGLDSGTILTPGSGGSFAGTQYGVAGWARNTSGQRAGGYFDAGSQGGTNVFAYIGYVRSDGGIRKIEGTGTVNTVMKTRSGMKSLFAPESPEAWFEDIGRGQLSNGHARIELDPLFLDVVTVSQEFPLNVFVQLNDDCSGVYIKSDGTGFEVHELQSGRSNAKFTYKVVAKWKGYEKERFPDALQPANMIQESAPTQEKLQ